MLILIDESGDPSFGVKSSEYFSVSAVVFEYASDAEGIAKKIKKFKASIGHNRELKYSKVKEAFSNKFFELVEVDKLKFRVLFFAIKKSDIKDVELKKEPKRLYFFVFKSLVAGLYGMSASSVLSVKIDRLNDKRFRKTVEMIVKGSFGATKVSFVNSQNDVLIQMADMYAGKVNRLLKSEKVKTGFGELF